MGNALLANLLLFDLFLLADGGAARLHRQTAPRMRSFVAGITEAIAYVKRRPTETKTILQKYIRVSDAAILQHTYDFESKYMEPVPTPSAEGTKTILEQFGVSGQPAEAFVTEFIDNRFMKQLRDDGLLGQLYPGGLPAR